jgi:hypothetical protein
MTKFNKLNLFNAPALTQVAAVVAFVAVITGLGYLTWWWSFLIVSFVIGFVGGRKSQPLLYSQAFATGILWAVVMLLNDWRFHGRLSMRLSGIFGLHRASFLYLGIIACIALMAWLASLAGKYWSEVFTKN